MVNSKVFVNPKLIKTKRELSSFYAKSLFSKPDTTHPKLDESMTRVSLKISSLAAQLILTKTLITSIGLKWTAGVIDLQLIESPFLSLGANITDIELYSPNSCYHDKECKTISL